MENTKNISLWPIAAGAVAIFGIVYCVKKKQRDDEDHAETQQQVALIESEYEETAQNIGNNSNMASLAQQFYPAFNITRINGQYVIGNFFSSASERQQFYDLAEQCTNLQDLMYYFNQLTDNKVPFLDAITRSDLSDEGKKNTLNLLRVQKVVSNDNGTSLGVYKGIAPNGMVEVAHFEANRFSADNWLDERDLFNANNVTIVNPV